MYAPQARLIDASSGRIVGSSAGSGAATSSQHSVVTSDLISATATIHNTGIGQLTLVLNNQRLDPSGFRPLFPPWKFNDFWTEGANGAGVYGLRFGQQIRLDLRYGSDPWTKVMLAQVTKLDFEFPADGGAHLTVTAEDLLSKLKVRPAQGALNLHQQEERILEDALHAVGPDLRYEATDRPLPERQEPLPSATHQEVSTYWDILSRLAEQLDCELYLDFVERQASGETGPIPAVGEVVVRMEPARSGIAPATLDDDWTSPATDDRSRYIQLRWGRSLIGFTPSINPWDIPTSAHVAGAGPRQRGRASALLAAADIQELLARELRRSPSYDLDPVDAVAARQHFYGQGDTNHLSCPASNLDSTRVQHYAAAQVLAKARQFMTAQAKTIGVPKLRPGMYVHILGLRPPFDGFYYVTKTVHSLSDSGYTTDLSLRRPGMLPPDGYMTAASDERRPESTSAAGSGAGASGAPDSRGAE